MISIIMSVYNERVQWVREATESMLNQTFRDFEFIIVIDNPNLPEDIAAYLKQAAQQDDRIRLLPNEKNVGLAQSLNNGIAAARGEFIARMDSDDISDIHRLEKEMAFLQKTGCDMVSSNKINIDEEGQHISQDPPIEKDPNISMPFGNPIIHSSVLMRTDAVRKLNGYRLMVNSEDYDLWMRWLDAGYTIGILDEPLLLYRLRANSASIGRQLEQFYVTRYIAALHKQRKKNNGKDSFSKQEETAYLKKCRLTEPRKRRFAKANRYVETALKDMQQGKKLGCAGNMLKASVCFPRLGYTVASNFIQYHRACK